jgi:hypothetical protein
MPTCGLDGMHCIDVCGESSHEIDPSYDEI